MDIDRIFQRKGLGGAIGRIKELSQWAAEENRLERINFAVAPAYRIEFPPVRIGFESKRDQDRFDRLFDGAISGFYKRFSFIHQDFINSETS